MLIIYHPGCSSGDCKKGQNRPKFTSNPQPGQQTISINPFHETVQSGNYYANSVSHGGYIWGWLDGFDFRGMHNISKDYPNLRPTIQSFNPTTTPTTVKIRYNGPGYKLRTFSYNILNRKFWLVFLSAPWNKFC